jgi:hypothetical protein
MSDEAQGRGPLGGGFSIGDLLGGWGRTTDDDEAVADLGRGVRYTLAGFLLFLDRDDDLARLLQQYPEEVSAAWAYTKALLAFRQHGDTPEVRRLLKEAEEQASAGAAPFAACGDSAAVVRYRHPPAPTSLESEVSVGGHLRSQSCPPCECFTARCRGDPTPWSGR